jgi:hypothetical protein
MRRWFLLAGLVVLLAIVLGGGPDTRSQAEFFPAVTGQNVSEYCEGATPTDPDTIFVANLLNESIEYSLTFRIDTGGSTEENLTHSVDGSLPPNESQEITYLDSEKVHSFDTAIPRDWDIDYNFNMSYAHGSMTYKHQFSGLIIYAYRYPDRDKQIIYEYPLFCNTSTETP